MVLKVLTLVILIGRLLVSDAELIADADGPFGFLEPDKEAGNFVAKAAQILGVGNVGERRQNWDNAQNDSPSNLQNLAHLCQNAFPEKDVFELFLKKGNANAVSKLICAPLLSKLALSEYPPAQTQGKKKHFLILRSFMDRQARAEKE